MEINKAFLQDRVAQMKAQREQLIANLNMLQGILNEDEMLIARLDAPEPAPEEPKVETAADAGAV